jgi:hypothetical protein
VGFFLGYRFLNSSSPMDFFGAWGGCLFNVFTFGHILLMDLFFVFDLIGSFLIVPVLHTENVTNIGVDKILAPAKISLKSEQKTAYDIYTQYITL